MNKDEYILGISAFFHDSAACLLKNGEIVSAVQEERLTRIKHDSSFPEQSINFCLTHSGITKEDLTKVVFYEKPILKFERILESYIKEAPRAFRPFKMAMKSWLKEKLWLPSLLRNKFGKETEILFAKHHEAHAAAACFTAPFNKGAFIVLDGVGEWASSSFGTFESHKLKTEKEIHYPHSIGLLYSAFTQYCGFKINSGEYKLMGLAPYGKPIFKQQILDSLLTINSDASYTINLDFFSFSHSLKTINKRFENLFGAPMRMPEYEMTQHYKDVAASIQEVTEDYLVLLVNYVSKKYETNNICLAGGVALNCAANGVLSQKSLHLNVSIQPASGDAGGAMGAALLATDFTSKNKKFTTTYLGPEYDEQEINLSLEKYPDLNFKTLTDKELDDVVSNALIDKKVIGWFQSRMEWGPRALGNRSILASPAFADMKKHINLKVKKREGFRPFAPVILHEHAREWFDMSHDSPFMLHTFNSLKPNIIPSCVHENNSARVQTVTEKQNKKLHDLISAFHEKTGIPTLINTSFNERGEAIVCTPNDALKCFFNTDIDTCVIGNHIINKEDNTHLKLETVRYDAD